MSCISLKDIISNVRDKKLLDEKNSLSLPYPRDLVKDKTFIAFLEFALLFMGVVSCLVQLPINELHISESREHE
ncbi:hypothetical protein Lal_00020855 [Lupinus albus]|nr:hypothetical protein Lal_00020855 [Lupinus albus]